jgi:hypothetical protein
MRAGGRLNRFFFLWRFYFFATILLDTPSVTEDIHPLYRVSLLPHHAEDQRGVEEKCASDQSGKRGICITPHVDNCELGGAIHR